MLCDLVCMMLVAAQLVPAASSEQHIPCNYCHHPSAVALITAQQGVHHYHAGLLSAHQTLMTDKAV